MQEMVLASRPFVSDAELAAYWTPLFEQLDDAVIFFDAQMEILKTNAAWNQFSTPPYTALNQYVYPEDVCLLIKEMHKSSKQAIHLRFIDDEQQLVWFEVNIQPIQLRRFSEADNGIRLWCMTAREQTQKIKARDLQNAQHRMLNGILKRMPIMLYRSRNNRDWSMEYVSEGCMKLTGHTEKELLNTPLYGQLIAPEDREQVWNNIQQALQQHGCFHIRYRLNRKDAAQHWVQEIGQGVYSDSGMVLGVDGVVFQTLAETHY